MKKIPLYLLFVVIVLLVASGVHAQEESNPQRSKIVDQQSKQSTPTEKPAIPDSSKVDLDDKSADAEEQENKPKENDDSKLETSPPKQVDSKAESNKELDDELDLESLLQIKPKRVIEKKEKNQSIIQYKEPPEFDLDTIKKTIMKSPVRHPHLKKDKEGVPLKIDGDEIFRIRASLGAYTPAIRVKSIERRIKDLEEDPDTEKLIQGLTVQESGYSTNIVAGPHTLFTVTDPDAKAEGYETREELAKDYAYLLKRALADDLKENTFEAFLIACGLSILTTVALFLIIKGINWVFRQIYNGLDRWKVTLISPLKIQEAELLSAGTISDLISGSIRFIRVIVFISIISIYLSFVLSYFPATKPIAQEGIHLLLRPIASVVWPSLVSYIPNMLFIGFILIATYYAIAFTHFIFREIERETIQLPGFDPDWSMPTYKIARFLVIAFALILLFPYLPGAGSPAFQQVSIFLGVLFSLASTGALSHIISGIFLTYTGAFRMGDRVKIADTIGDVTEKTLLATKVTTIKNEIITIPNGLVLGNHILNYSASARKGNLILHTAVTIGYDVPWQKVHEALIDAAKDTDLILNDPEPFVWQKELGDFSVKYEINACTEHPHKMAKIYADMHLNIQDIFHKRGIEILSPTYSAIRDGNKATIPEENLEASYTPPSFNVNLVGAAMNLPGKEKK